LTDHLLRTAIKFADYSEDTTIFESDDKII